MKIKELNQLAIQMVGDNKTPNVFFVTVKGNTELVTPQFEIAYDYWQANAWSRIESMVEDRKTGVICSAGMEKQYDHETDDFTKPAVWEVRDDSRTFGFRS
jgi:hypothetical protein